MEEMSFKDRVRKLQEDVKDPSFVENMIAEQKLFQDMFGFNDDQMRSFYEFARKLCSDKRYSDARDVFTVLTALNPFVCHFWLGLGLCHKFEGEYKSAIYDYTMAMTADMENPYAYFHLGDCYRKMEEDSLAKEFMEICIDKCRESDEFDALLKESEEYLRRLQMGMN